MLQYVRVKNLALMDEAELEFDSGFVAVTGETGAGKSILLSALSLLSGARAEKTKIRQGEELMELEGALYFEDADEVNALLASLELPECEDGQLLIHRSISRSKMPKIHINGRLSTQANLRVLGESWIDFHGPGEPQKLFKEKLQLQFLDLYAKNADLLSDYSRDFEQWRSLHKQIEDIRNADRLTADEVEFLRSQIDQIDQAELSEESIEELEQHFARLSGAQELVEKSNSVYNALCGNAGISEQLSPSYQSARELADIDESLASLADRIESLMIEASDIGEAFSDAARSCDFDEETAQQIQERMGLWQELRRKYGADVEFILERRNELEEKISIQGDIEGKIISLESSASELQKVLAEKAEHIREKRVTAAAVLTKATTELLVRLGFKKAKIQIEVFRESELKSHGNCACRILFAPNAGQELMPLNKIASSGELARVMLALKATLAKVDSTPVLVFDEADSNVGGEIAVAVGEELKALAKTHQVFCVTHLAQVAAMASTHWVVKKEQSDSHTSVSIEPIEKDVEERVFELARMLGDRNSSAAMAHARELLN